MQPNKVYIGGLPEHTRQEDLQSCFGKIGNITNIELKYVFGYLFVFPELIVYKGWLWFCGKLLPKVLVVELSLKRLIQEFDTREAAEESVAKYHEGFFMGNKIRVELSHGGGRTAKYAGDPGACFNCGQMAHMG